MHLEKISMWMYNLKNDFVNMLSNYIEYCKPYK
jgi:hypothetical protein